MNLEINEFISLKKLGNGKQWSMKNKKLTLGKMFILTLLILACIDIFKLSHLCMSLLIFWLISEKFVWAILGREAAILIPR